MKILVTGGAGFIGSSIVKLLCEEGHEVTVFDDLSTGYEEYIDKKARFVKANLGDIGAINKALEGQEAVIHLAAESIIEYSINDPEKTLKRNINYAINLLEGMRKNDVKFIVFSSSAAVYGEPKEETPVKEDSNKQPMQPYGASKLAMEAIFSGYYHSFGINSVGLRYFNVYGPRDDQIPVSRAVPRWIKSVLLSKPVQLYWGGKQRRDYIFVEDVAKAHLAVLGKEGCHQYNIGSGTGNTIKEILDAVFKAAGKQVEIIDAGERPGDPNFLVADASKIKQEVGWEAQVALDEGMKKTFEFYQNHPQSLERIENV